MTQLPPFLNIAASPQNKYLAEQRKKTIQFRFQISDSVFFNNFQRQIYKRFFKALFQFEIQSIIIEHTRNFFQTSMYYVTKYALDRCTFALLNVKKVQLGI